MEALHEIRPLLFSMALIGLYFRREENSAAMPSASNPKYGKRERGIGHTEYCIFVCGVLWFQVARYLPAFWVGVDYVSVLTAPRIMVVIWFFNTALCATVLVRGSVRKDHLPLFFKLWKDLETVENNSRGVTDDNGKEHDKLGQLTDEREKEEVRPAAFITDLEGETGLVEDESIKHSSNDQLTSKAKCGLDYKTLQASCAEEIRKRCLNNPDRLLAENCKKTEIRSTAEKSPPPLANTVTPFMLESSQAGDHTGADDVQIAREDTQWAKSNRAESGRRQPEDLRALGRSSRRCIIKITVVAWIVGSLNTALVGLFLTGLIEAAESTVVIHTNPFGSSIPVRVFVLFLHLYSSFAWIFPVAFMCALCAVLISKFHQITDDLSESILKSGDRFPDDLEIIKRRHFLLCDCVSVLDRTLSALVMSIFTTTIPLLCFNLYNLLSFQSDTFGLVMLVFWFLTGFIHIVIFSVSAALVHEAAHSPVDCLLKVNTAGADPTRLAQLQLFVSKLTGTSTGFTVLGILLVTKEMLLTLAGLFLTYFLLLLQYSTEFR